MQVRYNRDTPSAFEDAMTLMRESQLDQAFLTPAKYLNPYDHPSTPDTAQAPESEP